MTPHFNSLGELQDALEQFIKDMNIHPDMITVYKMWMVARNANFMKIKHCSQLSSQVKK